MRPGVFTHIFKFEFLNLWRSHQPTLHEFLIYSTKGLFRGWSERRYRGLGPRAYMNDLQRNPSPKHRFNIYEEMEVTGNAAISHNPNDFYPNRRFIVKPERSEWCDMIPCIRVRVDHLNLTEFFFETSRNLQPGS